MKPAAASALLGILFVAGCASARLPEAAGTPAVDGAALAQELKTRSTPAGPYQVNFAWTLEEAGSRARGRGVVRVAAPERIRLDLFGPRGETYLVAALVGSDYRLPPSVAAEVPLPSPVLLWAALGIFQTPAGAEITSATVDQMVTDLRFTIPGQDLYRYTFAEDAAGPALARVERAQGANLAETVTVTRDPAGAVRTSEYRDWTSFRNLTLEVESVRQVDSFPDEIWSPDA